MIQAYKQSWIRTFKAKGRMGRELYIKALIMHFVLQIPLFVMVFFDPLESENVLVLILSGILIIFSMASLFPIISSSIQRMHDVGKSGWYLLLYWLLNHLFFIGLILFGIQVRKESAEENQWGLPADAAESMAGTGEDSFVDERITEQQVKEEKKEMRNTLLKVFGIVILVIFVIPFFISLILSLVF